MKYKLHYAKLELDKDIPCLEFSSIKNRNNFITDKVISGGQSKVFILGIEHGSNIDSIYIFDNFVTISFLNDLRLSRWDTMFLQEYSSYEAAYEIALSMKEDSPLCYEPEESNKSIIAKKANRQSNAN
jgi:hypothetical protein